MVQMCRTVLAAVALLAEASCNAAIRKASFGLVSDFRFVDDLQRDGVAVIHGFETAESADSMRAAMAGLIEEWDPQSSRNSVL